MLNRRRMMMQALSSAEESSIYEWDYTMGAPNKLLWDYPISNGNASMTEDNGLYLVSSGSSYAGLRHKNYLAYLGQKSVYEVDVKVISTASNGLRIVCSSGSNGESDKHGLQVTLNGGYLNVLTGGTATNTVTKTAPLTYEEWHNVRLELDTAANTNKVYLDGALIATVANADLSTTYVSAVWLLIQGGSCYVRAVRCRKED